MNEFVRDESNTGALLNTNRASLAKYKAEKSVLTRLAKAENEIKDLRNIVKMLLDVRGQMNG